MTSTVSKIEISGVLLNIMRHWTIWNWNLSFCFLCLILFTVSLPPASADDEEEESGFSMDLGSVQLITLQPDSLHFDPSSSDMVRGYSSQQVFNARVSSNVEWLIQISGSESYWSGPWDKPVEDLEWKYGGGSYAALTTEAVDVTTGGPVNQSNLPIHFRVMLDFANDVPGDYQYEFILVELIAQ